MDPAQPLAFCPKCGAGRAADARFCGRCGADLGPAAAAPAVAEPAAYPPAPTYPSATYPQGGGYPPSTSGTAPAPAPAPGGVPPQGYGTQAYPPPAYPPQQPAAFPPPPYSAPPYTPTPSGPGASFGSGSRAVGGQAISPGVIALGISGVAVAVSPFLPWASSDFSASMTGMDMGGSDPGVALLSGLVIVGAAVGLQLRIATPVIWRALGIIAGLVGAYIGIHNISDANSLSGAFVTVNVEIGLWLLTAASIIAIVAAAWDEVASRRPASRA